MEPGSEEAPIVDERQPWEEVQALLQSLDLSDGLPLVPPTQQRLDAMLGGIAKANQPLGMMPPLMGELTARAVAYNCVLAGCVPDELPLVLTAAQAILEPEFNLLGIATTTGTPAVVVMVHGSAIDRLGMNSGSNCLGPGNRANACIGRAVQLVLRNIGGAKPGVGDMATMGQPGKYTFCFAEARDGALPPLHVRRGFDDGDAVVTVLGVSGTMEVLPFGGAATPEAVLDPVAIAMRAARDAASGGRPRQGGEQFFLLPPEMLQRILDAGWGLPAIQRHLFLATGGTTALVKGPEHIHPVVTGGAGVKMTHLPLWAGGTLSVTRKVAFAN